MLADKLHNLISIEIDLREGRPVWSHFHAERDRSSGTTAGDLDVAAAAIPDSRALAGQCRESSRAIGSLGE